MTTRWVLQCDIRIHLDTMDILGLVVLAAVVWHLLRSGDQRQRIAALRNFLRRYPIERLMEQISIGYTRALGESDTSRREQIWALLGTSEAELSSQFSRFAQAFAQVDERAARVSRVALPFAARWLPSACFDARQALAIHAQGLARLVRNDYHLPLRDKAYTYLAELLLMQHTCHWFCRSRAIASARMWTTHHTTYEQALAAVTPETREAYRALIGH